MQLPFDLTLLSVYAPYILIVAGIVLILWLVDLFVRWIPFLGTILDLLFKLIQALGIIVGIVAIASGVMVYSLGPTELYFDNATIALLFIGGFALVMRPMQKVPFVGILALAAGLGAAGAAYFLLPEYAWLSEMIFGTLPMNYVLGIAFIAGAFVVLIVLRPFVELIKFIGGLLGSKPVSIIVGGACILQGVLVLYGLSILTYLPI